MRGDVRDVNSLTNLNDYNIVYDGGTGHWEGTKTDANTTATTGYCHITPDWYNNHYYHWYPNYYPVTIQVDTTKKAFEIVKVLQDKKVIKLSTVKQFVELVDSILKIL